MIKPIPEHVIVTKTEDVAPSSTLIQLLPNTTKQTRGVVLAVHDRDSTVEVGDLILFGKHSTKTIRIGDEDFLLLHQNNIMAKIS